MSQKPRIALVHDELIRRGGAEIVFEELVRLFPQADVYALYAGNRPRLTVNDKTYPIHTSSLQKLPLWFRRHPGRMLPLLSQAAEQFDLSNYDLVISSASGFAKGVITRANVPHICYCHTPTRYLWENQREVMASRSFLARPFFAALQHYLRLADYSAAQRPDIMIANSRYTEQRIKTYYRRESEVIYPPIDTTFFTPQANKLEARSYFLTIGRLTPSKHFDHAVETCEKLDLPLVVVGVGKEGAKLRKRAGKSTTFAGNVSKEKLRELLRNARALIQPGVEDFGMAAAEALACGTPVIAYGRGGVREIVDHGRHGLLYQEQRIEYLAETARQFLQVEGRFQPEILQQRALKFEAKRFEDSIREQVSIALRENERNTVHI